MATHSSTVKGYDIVNKAKIDVFLELSCFFNDPGDVGNFKVVKQEMTRVNIDILGIRELKQTGIGEFNAILGCNLRNERMISISFQGKPFSITVVQVYVPTSNTKKLKLNSL